MKVAYDISVLGQGYINPKARTGIYRVIESLLFELVNQSDMEIVTTSLHPFSNAWDEASTILYLQNRYPKLVNNFYKCYCSQSLPDSLYKRAAKLQHKLTYSFLSNSPLLYKFSNAIQIPFQKLANFSKFPKALPKKLDVYHSSFLPLPSDKLFEKTARIITIYDVIPLLHPEKFTDKINYIFNLIVNSINYNNDWVICISENTKQDFCNITGMKSDRVFVTPLAAASHFYPIANLETIASTLKKYKIPYAPYLLSLCTLEPRKNLVFLLKCFSQIIADNPSLEINLVLVGASGWKNSDIFQAVKSNSVLQSKVIITGYIPDEDLSAVYSGATAFVYPSLYEGFGLPPLEAMQCGTPVITSNTSSLPEVVGNAGIMIDPTQKDELCQALLNIINNADLREKMSYQGKLRANQFSWSKCAAEIAQVYRIAASY